MKYFLSLILAAVCLAAAADEKNNASSTEQSERGRGRGGRSMRRGGGFMEQIKSKYPKEYAELEKLRESDPDKFHSKMRDLMRKAMPEMGMMRRGGSAPMMEPSEEQLKELKAKYPTDFAEYEKLKKSDEEKAKAKLQDMMKKYIAENGQFNEKNLRDRNRRATAFVMDELKRRYPEKMKAIEDMQQTDPDGARAELRKLFADSEMRMPGGHRELNYEYVPPQQQNNNRPWGGGMMMNRGNFPFGGGRMWGTRR